MSQAAAERATLQKTWADLHTNKNKARDDNSNHPVSDASNDGGYSDKMITII